MGMKKIDCNFTIPKGFTRVYALEAETMQHMMIISDGIVGLSHGGLAYGQRLLPGKEDQYDTVPQGRILDWMAESMADARREAEGSQS